MTVEQDESVRGILMTVLYVCAIVILLSLIWIAIFGSPKAFGPQDQSLSGAMDREIAAAEKQYAKLRTVALEVLPSVGVRQDCVKLSGGTDNVTKLKEYLRCNIERHWGERTDDNEFRVAAPAERKHLLLNRHDEAISAQRKWNAETGDKLQISVIQERSHLEGIMDEEAMADYGTGTWRPSPHPR